MVSEPKGREVIRGTPTLPSPKSKACLGHIRKSWAFTPYYIPSLSTSSLVPRPCGTGNEAKARPLLTQPYPSHLSSCDKAEEKKLEAAEKYLEESATMFDEFLKENDKNAVEAIKM